MSEKDLAIARIMDLQQRFQHMLASDRSNPFFELNLTMPQLKVMLILATKGGAGGQELVGVLGVTLATMTGIVDRLVAADLVTRREDPQDRRVRRVELTESGRQLIDKLVDAGTEHQRRLLLRLDIDELQTVERAMEIMHRAMSAEAAADR
ncbi:DNA-binding MarR family transcriptional regulator [Allocatelliglobosispora scoriae]|uniref:DNA-binding MarR family transcriptional regulator n=1 Tax=Allocatelliglobosispora scoriae TaxID=643052 RepID=A0A841BYD4_9ACTN|nr:MarR family transcriptional regulator [Allocatelliglobosispora scoriae]MBB5871802.1 DNA-binding MarR family transcriptional regulator [Allocatelliglobosispora scoriae]